MNPPASCPHDPFKEPRREKGVLVCDFEGETIPMILRYKDVKRAAKDYETYSSDVPFRVPIPSEEDVRSVRQLPIETNPPEHTEYRAIVEPFFKRPTQPEMMAEIEALIGRMLDEAGAQDSLEIVREFSLPLQSRALTYLLRVPESEAERWIGWGTHVFREGDGESKGAELERYIHEKLDAGMANPGDDFFSALSRATYRGRPLTRDEMVGFANLTFAGGRDTVIGTTAHVIGYLAEHPEAVQWLREDPKRVTVACEEFVRMGTPLTHIGRTCPVDTDVHGVTVKAGNRVALGWASANFDETIFECPEEVKLDRKPNPHIAFGSGPHTCLGAPHARLILRTLVRLICERFEAIEMLENTPHVVHRPNYTRRVGFDALRVRFRKRAG